MFPCLLEITIIAMCFYIGAVSLPEQPGHTTKFIRRNPENLETLLLAQVLFRHGDRTPIIDYKTNPYKNYNNIYGVEGSGQLTPIGRKQAYNLGVYLRHRYANYLSPKYTYDQVYVQSSDVDRTILTGLSCLEGLFPPLLTHGKKYNFGKDKCLKHKKQLVPIHVLSKSVDNKLSYTKTCKRFDQLYMETLNSTQLIALNKREQDLYKFLENKTGNKVTNFEDVYYIYDTLFINELYGLVLPDWTKQIFPDKLSSIGNIIYTIASTTEEMKHLHTGPFLEELIRNMDKRIGNPVKFQAEDLPKAKMYLYAGHDDTISSVLIALGVYDGIPPPYTAAVIFELHKIKNSGSIQVKLFYRPDQTDQTFELILPKCEKPCTLNNFKSAYFYYWYTSLGWDIECENTTC